MPLSVDQYRPQTIKQAKKAYRKAGAIPRLSEVELRRLDRFDQLLERADRLKTKEQRKKANLKKKEEKLEKEKEARRKAGLPELKEAYIGPSQLKLDSLGVVKRPKDNENRDRQGILNFVEPPARLPSRIPLQHKSSNITTQSKLQETCPVKYCSSIAEDSIDFVVSNTQIEQDLSTPETLPLSNSTPDTFLREEHDETLELLAMVSSQNLTDPEELGSEDKILKDKPESITKHDLEGAGKSSFSFPDMDSEDCRSESEVPKQLEKISTPDLGDIKCDISFLPIVVKQNSPTPSAVDSENFGSDGIYMDENLQQLVRIEFSPTVKSISTQVGPVSKATTTTNSASQKKQVNNDSLYDENAPSSQELLALAREMDFDEFEISTPDLQDFFP